MQVQICPLVCFLKWPIWLEHLVGPLENAFVLGTKFWFSHNNPSQLMTNRFLQEPSFLVYISVLAELIRTSFYAFDFQLEFCTASNNGRQKIRQKICQIISVIKTSSSDWELLTFDDIKEIVHFGILINILSWKQKC